MGDRVNRQTKGIGMVAAKEGSVCGKFQELSRANESKLLGQIVTKIKFYAARGDNIITEGFSQ